MRKFVLVVVLAVLAWIFVVPSCSTQFDCAAAPATAHADDNECPSSLDAAANDRAWAAARLATIQDEDVTTGLLYDGDGGKVTLMSGKDSNSKLADKIIGELGGPKLWVATHVEVKAAAIMREKGISHAVLVINKDDGVCEIDSDGKPRPYSCQGVVPRILPEGSTLAVWSPLEIREGGTSVKLKGVVR